MPPKKKVYQFKITLKDTKPPIWRRIQVPSTNTFWALHIAIQDAMGWTDCHMHEFNVNYPLSRSELCFGVPDKESDFELDKTTLPGWKYKISKYINLMHPTCEYVYDFGDYWRHKVDLEGIFPVEVGLTYPRCLKGKRACPPEDCGGPWGYQELLEVLSDQDNEEYEDSKVWIESFKGWPFDQEHFDPLEVEFSDPKERFEIAFSD